MRAMNEREHLLSLKHGKTVSGEWVNALIHLGTVVLLAVRSRPDTVRSRPDTLFALPIRHVRKC